MQNHRKKTKCQNIDTMNQKCYVTHINFPASGGRALPWGKRCKSAADALVGLMRSRSGSFGTQAVVKTLFGV